MWRKMTQPGPMRSFHVALAPPAATHVHAVHSLALESPTETVVLAGLWSSLPLGLVKVGGKPDMMIARHFPSEVTSLVQLIALRTLRLNCLTAEFKSLWEDVFDEAWMADRWAAPDLDRVELGDVEAIWSMETPLRRDQERRLALVELGAIGCARARSAS